ncbi:MAG: substrate-binding domain-containing protein [Rhizobiaceae bacterium]
MLHTTSCGLPTPGLPTPSLRGDVPPQFLLKTLPPRKSALARRPTGGGSRSGRRRRLRIANLLTSSGSPGIWGPASSNSLLLAVAELNKRGGILGREVDLTILEADGPVEDIARRTEDAIAFDGVEVVMGSHTSAVRVAVREVTRGRVPYIYTPVYEGGERTSGVMAIGETPRCQSRPAIHWLAEAMRARRWYLVGSDYVWPRQSQRAARRYIGQAGGQIVGEEFVAVGDEDHAACLERIRIAQPDVVMVSLIGADSITFNRAFAESGLAATTLRLVGGIDETVLLGIGADNTENIFCASGYFTGFASRANDDFLARYHAMFGDNAPPTGSVAQSNYEGLRFLQAAAQQAGTLAVGPLTQAGRNIVYSGARGSVSIRDGHADMRMHIARADGLDFRLIKTV